MQVYLTESAERYLSSLQGVPERPIKINLTGIDWKGPRYELALVEPEKFQEYKDYVIKQEDINFLYDDIVARSARNISIDYQEIAGNKALLVYNKDFKKEELKEYQAEIKQ